MFLTLYQFIVRMCMHVLCYYYAQDYDVGHCITLSLFRKEACMCV
jgi:hypothetical protein